MHLLKPWRLRFRHHHAHRRRVDAKTLPEGRRTLTEGCAEHVAISHTSVICLFLRLERTRHIVFAIHVQPSNHPNPQPTLTLLTCNVGNPYPRFGVPNLDTYCLLDSPSRLRPNRCFHGSLTKTRKRAALSRWLPWLLLRAEDALDMLLPDTDRSYPPALHGCSGVNGRDPRHRRCRAGGGATMAGQV